MDTSVLLRQRVIHSYYGSGEIVDINDKQLQVHFEIGDLKKFQFPQAFGTYLMIEDGELMSKILKEKLIRKQEEDRRKAEEAEKAKIRAQQEAEKRLATVSLAKTSRKQSGNMVGAKAISGKKQEMRAYDGRIIDLETTFATHAETLNGCFGYHYVHYQQAYKDLENGYAVWFPRIAKKSAGQYLSSDSYWGWINILSDSGETITQMDNPDFPYTGGGPEKNRRLIFARFEGENRYRFIGIYANAERVQNGTMFTRVGVKFDTKMMKIIL